MKRIKRHAETDMENLDYNLIAEILSHLPLKNLFRCRSVCKRWRSLISSHPIIGSRCGRGYSSGFFVWGMHKEEQLYKGKMAFIYNLDEDVINSYANAELCLPGNSNRGSQTETMAIPRSICDGLVFYYHLLRTLPDQFSQHFYIGNPETMERVSIPKYTIEGTDFITGLAFDPTNKDHGNNIASYKIVIAGFTPPELQFQFKLYSSDTRSWRESRPCCQKPPNQRQLLNQPLSIFYHGVLHWLVVVDSVLTFDPESETSKWVDMPSAGDDELDALQENPVGGLMEWGGDLYYVRIGTSLRLNVWKMSDYSCCSGANARWVLLHSIERFVPHIVENWRTYPIPWLFPVAVDNEGDRIMFSTFTCQVILYDLRSKRVLPPPISHSREKLNCPALIGPWYMHYVPTTKFLTK